ncbi:MULTISPECIES: amidase [Pandoraea]|uniref:amidase n=1 Tax=Pandoraea TaxID=93217 RepID=UPI001F5C37CC|nr:MULTISPECIES: amidase [Pandoraea]MCI3206720.1 amidase [Pandoraea sp. LA3]MDN4584748.1 amidase [Pandoraea capi]
MPIASLARQSTLLQPGHANAFVAEGFGIAPHVVASSDELRGLRLAVKDVFDVEGQRLGAGNPLWLGQQTPATSTALIVARLLEAGAQWIGKTVTDELAFSLLGINTHYGTPDNAASPGRIVGGSSSGSAAAVAAGFADIGLGTDCGGSCRLPASHCGVWGIRPTQGRIAGRGGFSLAHSFDTAGWFTRDADTLASVFTVLTEEVVPTLRDTASTPLKCHIALDAVADCTPAVRAALPDLLARLGMTMSLTTLSEGELPLDDWAKAHRWLQGAEIWQQHGHWVREHGHSLAPDVLRRFLAGAAVSRQEVSRAQRTRVHAMQHLARVLDDPHAVLIFPTSPDTAPARHATQDALEAHRSRAQRHLCISGLAGLPEVSLPWLRVATSDGPGGEAPVGLSVVGARGNDALVIAAASRLADIGLA